MAIKTFEQFEHNKLTEIINKYEDFEKQSWEFAKWVFEQEEGREPNINNDRDLNAVSLLQVGINWARKYCK